jgi:hypothetical protein
MFAQGRARCTDWLGAPRTSKEAADIEVAGFSVDCSFYLTQI